MPMYDRICVECGEQKIDCLEPIVMTEPVFCRCGGETERAWLSKAPAAIGDEIDITVKHGICNEDGTPRRYRSKAEMRRVEKERRVYNKVQHVGSPGSDKNRHGHTTRWV